MRLDEYILDIYHLPYLMLVGGLCRFLDNNRKRL